MEYTTESNVFEDRAGAGERLADLLLSLRDEHPVVLALPRGGVEVGYYVARALEAPLDVIVARKLGAPGQEELGIGAIAPGGVQVVDEHAVHYLGVKPEMLDRIAQRERVEMERRIHQYRGDRPPVEVRDRTVIIVDDGLATGVTARAAIRSVQQLSPKRVILAVPVCAGDTAESIRVEGVEVVCAMTPPNFRAVGYWYRDFQQLTDGEVIGFLNRARGEHDLPDASDPAWTGIRTVRVGAGGLFLDGDLTVPADARGVVLFAHGSGSSRHSPRNRYVAGELQRAGMATLLMDLLTPSEEAEDSYTGHLRFDIGLLATRLQYAIEWLRRDSATSSLPIGCFGASTGAGAALVAAAACPDDVRAVVSRGGRPDLAGSSLARVQAPTLLIVGGADGPVIGMNRDALAQMRVSEKELVIIPNATHLFPEPGALEEVARLAAEWFGRHLVASGIAQAA